MMFFPLNRKKQLGFESPFFIACFFIYCLAFTPLLSASSVDKNPSLNPTQKECLEQIKARIEIHTLEPVFQKGSLFFKPTRFLADSPNTTYVYGNFEQDATCYHSLICVKKEPLSSKFETQVLYLTTNSVPSPLLFHDITRYIPPPYLPGDLKELCVFIEKSQIHPSLKGSTLHRWVFFTPFNSKAFDITLTPDGQGGNYFQVDLVDATEEQQRQFTLDCLAKQLVR